MNSLITYFMFCRLVSTIIWTWWSSWWNTVLTSTKAITKDGHRFMRPHLAASSVSPSELLLSSLFCLLALHFRLLLSRVFPDELVTHGCGVRRGLYEGIDCKAEPRKIDQKAIGTNRVKFSEYSLYTRCL